MTTSQIKILLLSMAKDYSVPLEQIEYVITKFIQAKPILPFTDFQYKFVVRCSPNNGKKDGSEVFNHVNRCSYNPEPYKIPLQRCNYPEQQVLYATVTSKTKQLGASSSAVLETMWWYIKNRKINRYYFTLSRWRTNRKLKVFVLPFAPKSHKRNDDFKEMNKKYISLLKQDCKKYNVDYREIKDFMAFMSNLFCTRSKSNYYYRISSAFCNSILKCAPHVDGLLYPSSMSRAEGMNIVLRKELILKRTLKCDYATMMAIQRNPSNPKDIWIIKASSDVFPDETGRLYFKHIW